tara:strand:- start:73232 stop:74203 length:972 start_codon:yes stop_codon:yes gene_type:complete
MTDRLTIVILIIAILSGSTVGLVYPQTTALLASQLDNMILLLVFLIFFEVRVQDFFTSLHRVHFIIVALIVNFVVIPGIGFAISTAFLSSHPLIVFGLTIYFMAPCTDWFLGFTHLAKGNTALGAALLPANLVIQLLLYPVYLNLFGIGELEGDVSKIPDTLLQWFLIPLLSAFILRIVVERLANKIQVSRFSSFLSCVIPILLAILVGQIFASNISKLITYADILPLVLCAILVFFLLTLSLSELLARLLRLNYGDHVLLTMTTSARNAPLMLAVTIAVLPHQSLMHAAIILGMIIELPYLVALNVVFQRRLAKKRMMSVQF